MSGRLRDFEHVLRVALLFVLGVVAFLGVRAWLVPDDFGVYGYFRTGAIDDNRAHPLVHAGRAACVDCHSDVVNARRGGRHERIGCEACHGPLARHASGEDETKPARPDTRATCIRCHEKKAGKPAGFPQVSAAEHAASGPCSECHNPHRPGIS
jgi:hypothetical protein